MIMMATHRILLAFLLVVGTCCATAASAIAATLAVVKDVTLCKRLVDLKELNARIEAGDKTGSSLYLEGADPPCMVLKAGDVVEQLDEADGLLQVLTRHGTPLLIGWGDRSSFSETP